MGRKYVDEHWDFRTADTKAYTHGFHNYPAIMIPQIAGELIDKFCKSAKLLFDPYCGAGTSLVEAYIRGIDSIGTDLNPLARLLTKAKTTPLDTKELNKYLKNFSDIVFSNGFGIPLNGNHKIPELTNIDYWFNKETQKELAFIKDFIDQIENSKIRDFFKVAFSETVRESSWTRNGEFKLYRMTEKQMRNFKPNVFSVMEKKLLRAQKGLAQLIKDKKGKANVEIYDFNTVQGVPEKILKRESVDIIVTSPPYGDSRTTVAYGQYSRLSNEWLDFKEANKVDRRLMGGNGNGANSSFMCKALDEAIKQIASNDSKRVRDVIGFYTDYKNSIDNIAPLVRKGGYSCYVVGNRKVKGVVLPTDEITRKFFENNGFRHIETIIRNIPNKRMPSKNSPTNIHGKLDSTMTNEYIVIMRKNP